MRVGVKEEEEGVWKMVFVEQFKAIVLIDRGFYFFWFESYAVFVK